MSKKKTPDSELTEYEKVQARMKKPFRGFKGAAKPRKRSVAPTAFSDILPAVGQAMRLDEKIREWTVLSLWSTLVDPVFKERTQAVRIQTKGNRKHLIVKAADSATASELTFYLAGYQERLNRYQQETGCTIHHIDIWIGT